MKEINVSSSLFLVASSTEAGTRHPSPAVIDGVGPLTGICSLVLWRQVKEHIQKDFQACERLLKEYSIPRNSISDDFFLKLVRLSESERHQTLREHSSLTKHLRGSGFHKLSEFSPEIQKLIKLYEKEKSIGADKYSSPAIRRAILEYYDETKKGSSDGIDVYDIHRAYKAFK